MKDTIQSNTVKLTDERENKVVCITVSSISQLGTQNCLATVLRYSSFLQFTAAYDHTVLVQYE